MEIEARRDDRGYALIANFVGGFALGWKMAVPVAFKEALDIKLTQRIIAKKKEMFWTQGRIYDFHEGDTIHDTSFAYSEWSKALNHIKISVQIQFASSSGYVTYETIKVENSDLEIINQKGKAKPKEEIVDGLVVSKQRIDYGLVRFKVYRPNRDKTALNECETIECNQDDFVAFLQTGVVRTNENIWLNLFAENA